MIDLHQRISAFKKLGNKLRNLDSSKIRELIKDSVRYNGWFTEDMVNYMILAIGESLDEDKLNKWAEPYGLDIGNIKKQKTIGVVMAGNIPAVGFHDFLSVLMSGNKLKAKLSGDDNQLLPAIAELLVEIEPAFEKDIEFTEERLQDFDAIIATGSSNTARYFEYYFGKYPNIIRKNRNGIAVLNGSESDEELKNYLDAFEPTPFAWHAMQAEGREWLDLFSEESRARFDYAFTDAMTWTNDNGKRMRLWIPSETEVGDPQDFMDQLVDRIVGIVTNEPINIYVNPTYLPVDIADRYDELWTDARINKVVEALVESGVALEINNRNRIPSATFITKAKEAGVKFTIGTNNGGANDLGRMDYAIQIIGECGLTPQDMWIPAM